MALTRVAPAGIGSTPGTGYVIGDSFLHSRGLNATDGYYTGIVTTQSLRVIGDLEVEGTTTTLDTALTEVDKLEVGANNNTVGVAITQSGTGDILNLYDGSTQVVTVKDGGTVGIGTNSPQRKLHTLGTQSNTVRFENTSTNDAFIEYKGTTGTSYAGHTGNDFVIAPSSTEQVRIKSDGKVGIGTDNPGQKLQVQDGHIDVTNGSGHSYSFSYGKFTAERSAAQTTSEVFQGGYTGNTETSKIYADGKAYFLNNVGIGTDNPGVILDVRETKTAGSTQVRVYNTDNSNATTQTAEVSLTPDSRALAGAGIKVFKENADFSTNAGRDISLALNVVKNNSQTEALRITSTGRVGIGTDSPDNLLHLSGTNTTVWPFGSDVSGLYAYSPYPHELQIQNHARDVTGSFAGIYFHSGASPDGSYISAARIAAIDSGNYRSDLAFGTRNTNFGERLRIKYDGNIGINQTNPTRKLHITMFLDLTQQVLLILIFYLMLQMMVVLVGFKEYMIVERVLVDKMDHLLLIDNIVDHGPM